MQTMENNIQKWKSGLSKTRKSTFGKIASFLGASEINSDTWEDLEALLIQADIGVGTSLDIINQIKILAAEHGIITRDGLFGILSEELRKRLMQPEEIPWQEGPTVILITGVNGSGKTTSIAKLGRNFQDQGKKVLFVAADTFRAAAIEQLEIWGRRLNIPVIAGQKNGDPGAVVFDGIQSALAKKYDLVLIDTAGRLHTQINLMEELKKVYRVAGKALPGAPHATWLVMDATTGQNALHQAESFLDVIPLDGIVLAKLDSSAKGGMTFAIQEKLNLPILYAGLGEDILDLVPFNPDKFVSGLLNQD